MSSVCDMIHHQCNHSHRLVTINCCYDPAIFYIQIKNMKKNTINMLMYRHVLKILYGIFLGDVHQSEYQIMNCQIRLEDINKLKNDIKINGKQIIYIYI